MKGYIRVSMILATLVATAFAIVCINSKVIDGRALSQIPEITDEVVK